MGLQCDDENFNGPSKPLFEMFETLKISRIYYPEYNIDNHMDKW